MPAGCASAARPSAPAPAPAQAQGGGERDRDQQLVADVVAREPHACRTFITTLTPVIRARVARAMGSQRGCRRHSLQSQELHDLTQEIFLILLDRDGRILRSWRPERGLSLANFVGLVAEREARAFLRSGRRSGWAELPTCDDSLTSSVSVPAPERRIASRQLLQKLSEELCARLSPRDVALFNALLVEQHDIEVVAQRFEMSATALYTFRSRVRGQLRALRERHCDDAAPRAAVA